MNKTAFLLSSTLIVIQGCTSNSVTEPVIQPTNAQVQNQKPTSSIDIAKFSEEKRAWLASEAWSYHGNGLTRNIGWNDQMQKGDLDFVASYNAGQTQCQGEIYIAGPLYGNRISGILNINGQDVHFKYVSKVNDKARLYQPKNPAGLSFLLAEFEKGNPVVVKSDIGVSATFPSTDFKEAKQAIDSECQAKILRDKNAL
ncbi:hypothetical protein [Vibrio superstes]|uniref:Lipoprotein n=1 Tax=Vibrio superstes NBRC 103154 TaxID=1219062 RepID=A0A511QPQ4_9VIBR|nr:hypothetical protein [Vibrio superstes]GEM79321.1 hypothetical protein VSU01S_15660 [Vibrio superstes NBRC 103154]